MTLKSNPETDGPCTADVKLFAGGILYLMQYPYDPGTLPTSANQRMLGKVYLRSNLTRETVCRWWWWL